MMTQAQTLVTEPTHLTQALRSTVAASLDLFMLIFILVLLTFAAYCTHKALSFTLF